MEKKNIVIAAVNFFEGGPLSILNDCLQYLNNSDFTRQYHFIALVHKKELFSKKEYKNIQLVEYPKSRTSYLYRLYYEYFHFKSVAKKYDVFFWLSLHDITPNVGNTNQAVYCHNPSPFNKLNIKDISIQPTQFFFTLFYKYLYKKNIKKNKFVIVQQLWIKHRFQEMFNLKGNSIITAIPQIPKIDNIYLEKNQQKTTTASSKKVFFFPTFPRPFKNIEVICEAVKLINKEKNNDIEIIITIDGSENNYSKSIVTKYQHLKNINFIGLIQREEVYNYYAECDVLIFPSKLETWGLPISEYKQFQKPMLVSDLAYAKETVGSYDLVRFFNPDDAKQLSELMIDSLENKLAFDTTKPIIYEQPFVHGWNDLFNTLLK
ncbi:MAG: glycosyltransferase [Flaviramulus sp.]|nr:glycosyltransferase [Flaviramulus sp.]